MGGVDGLEENTVSSRSSPERCAKCGAAAMRVMDAMVEMVHEGAPVESSAAEVVQHGGGQVESDGGMEARVLAAVGLYMSGLWRCTRGSRRRKR